MTSEHRAKSPGVQRVLDVCRVLRETHSVIIEGAGLEERYAPLPPLQQQQPQQLQVQPQALPQPTTTGSLYPSSVPQPQSLAQSLQVPKLCQQQKLQDSGLLPPQPAALQQPYRGGVSTPDSSRRRETPRDTRFASPNWGHRPQQPSPPRELFPVASTIPSPSPAPAPVLVAAAAQPELYSKQTYSEIQRANSTLSEILTMLKSGTVNPTVATAVSAALGAGTLTDSNASALLNSRIPSPSPSPASTSASQRSTSLPPQLQPPQLVPPPTDARSAERALESSLKMEQRRRQAAELELDQERQRAKQLEEALTYTERQLAAEIRRASSVPSPTAIAEVAEELRVKYEEAQRLLCLERDEVEKCRLRWEEELHTAQEFQRDLENQRGQLAAYRHELDAEREALAQTGQQLAIQQEELAAEAQRQERHIKEQTDALLASIEVHEKQMSEQREALAAELAEARAATEAATAAAAAMITQTVSALQPECMDGSETTPPGTRSATPAASVVSSSLALPLPSSASSTSSPTFELELRARVQEIEAREAALDTYADRLRAEQALLHEERQRLQEVKAQLQEEALYVQDRRDRLQDERQQLLADRTTLQEEHRGLAEARRHTAEERQAVVAERQRQYEARCELEREQQAVEIERKKIECEIRNLQELQLLVQEKQHLEQELQRMPSYLPSPSTELNALSDALKASEARVVDTEQRLWRAEKVAARVVAVEEQNTKLKATVQALVEEQQKLRRQQEPRAQENEDIVETPEPSQTGNARINVAETRVRELEEERATLMAVQQQLREELQQSEQKRNDLELKVGVVPSSLTVKELEAVRARLLARVEDLTTTINDTRHREQLSNSPFPTGEPAVDDCGSARALLETLSGRTSMTPPPLEEINSAPPSAVNSPLRPTLFAAHPRTIVEPLFESV